ncbi:nitrate reductase [Marinomonas atlantica]|uniref:nitrate reductase n=1 Tax=Marinomonas atlantica TaxID=1806668 RepID=UPI00083225F5|nr:nitrate reductase [Marinomonas atlantica]
MTVSSVKTTCPYCGVGCGVNLSYSKEPSDTVLPVSGDDQHPANFGRLCVKGSSLAQTITLDDRMLTPQVNGKPSSWEHATDVISHKIRDVIAKHGPNAFAFYLSGQILTEDYYVANKLAKGFIGTANVDTNSRLCMASAVVGYKRAFGSDTVPCNYEDLERCDLLIMVGSNAAWTHPVLFQRIVAAKAKRPEMRVVVIDPRRTATCDVADLHLAITPGSDAAIFSYLLNDTAQHESLDHGFIDSHTDNFDLALNQAQASTPDLETTAEFCNIAPHELNLLCELWRKTDKTVTFYSQGVNQSSSGVDKCNAIINCHLATGRIGKEGAGPFSITGQPNAMGGREVGGLANQLAAHMDFATPGAQDLVKRFWNAPNMATENGLKAVDLFQAMEQGDVKIVWIMSTNPMVSIPDTAQVQRALEKCDLVIVSDVKAHTDTTAYADVLLPATGWSEKDGTVTNSERRISRQRGLLPAPEQAMHDWQSICDVAKKLGYQSAFSYSSPHEIFAEHAALSTFENNGKRDFDIGVFKNISREQYDQFTPIQWPVTQQAPYGTARMFEDKHFYTPNGRAQFFPITPRLPQAHPSKQYPLTLNTGRIRDQWHTMTRTGDAAVLARHISQPFVEIHPQDALQYDIQDKALVTLTSPHGRVIVKAKISDETAQGSVFVPIHWTKQFASKSVISALVPPVVDPLSGQPESKHAQAAVSPIKNATYGSLISETELNLSDCLYWCKVPSEFGHRYEVAWPEKIPLSDLKSRFDSHSILDLQWLEYSNPINHQTRLAGVQNDHLKIVIYLSDSPTVSTTDWLISRLSLQQSLSDSERMALLVGKPVDMEDKGEIVCACFQVGTTQIEKSVKQGACSIESLGIELKCGTNCGSCIPELKALITSNVETES